MTLWGDKSSTAWFLPGAVLRGEDEVAAVVESARELRRRRLLSPYKYEAGVERACEWLARDGSRAGSAPLTGSMVRPDAAGIQTEIRTGRRMVEFAQWEPQTPTEIDERQRRLGKYRTEEPLLVLRGALDMLLWVRGEGAAAPLVPPPPV